jgi:hypothetical protein
MNTLLSFYNKNQVQQNQSAGGSQGGGMRRGRANPADRIEKVPTHGGHASGGGTSLSLGHQKKLMTQKLHIKESLNNKNFKQTQPVNDIYLKVMKGGNSSIASITGSQKQKNPRNNS